MSGPLANLEERIAKLEAAADGLREATREAHEAIKSLKLLKRECEHLLVDEPRRIFDEHMAEAVRVGLAGYAEVIQTKQAEAVEQVGRTFDELARIYVHGGKGEDDLPTLAAKARAGLPRKQARRA